MIDHADVEQLLPMYRQAYHDPINMDDDRAARRWLAWGHVTDRLAVRIADTLARMTAGSPYPDRSDVDRYVRTRDHMRDLLTDYYAARGIDVRSPAAAAAP